MITNYRPISVLNFFSKIFEKVVANYIVDFLESNNILYEHQYGFRKGHSTNHAVITLVERVAKALDTGKIVVGVYLDIRIAFDAIDHPILLRKLYSLGIRGNLYTWIKSYLTNRSQFVMYNNSKSETKFITHGVPQGSILGPLFFIVLMNDFSRASNILFSILFADDTTVIIESQNYNNLILTLNTELNKLDVWLQANKLILNTDKTHYMVYHRAIWTRSLYEIYILPLCTHTSYIVLRFEETHVPLILIQSLKSKRNVFQLSLSHITWSLPNHYLKT